MKKGTMFLTVALAGACAVALSGCGKKNDDNTSKDGGTITVAALEGGTGKAGMEGVVEAFKKEFPDVTVNLKISKTIEDEISPDMKAGNYPDIVFLAQGREKGLTESMIKDKALEDVSDVADLTIPGESTTVGDKLIDGIVGGLATNPYGDSKTYLMPTAYSPSGLFYDANLLEKNGWSVPTTLDEFYKLGDDAKAKGIDLFTYPTAGYLDGFFFSLIPTVAGESFFEKVENYDKDVWVSADGTKVLDIASKILSQYTAKSTVGNANDQDYLKNQQSILDDKAIFMPNGTWVTGEMQDAPRADGFKWGFTALPAVESGGDRYVNTYAESIWIPSAAKNKELAKKFMAFCYSDKAAEIFADKGAVQPIKGVTQFLDEENKVFYDIYNQPGVKAVVGAFASTQPVEGVTIRASLFDPANSIISGDKTEKQWQDGINEASNKLLAAKD